LAGSFFVVWRCAVDPSIPFLTAQPPAEWIVYPGPPKLEPSELFEAKPAGRLVRFRNTFALTAPLCSGGIRLRAFREYVLWVNGTRIAASGSAETNWKRVKEYDVRWTLRPGENEVVVEVANATGPPALWLTIETDALTLHTDRRWQAQAGEGPWLAARPATQLQRLPEEMVNPTVVAGWLRAWPVILLWVAAALAATCVGLRWASRRGVGPSDGSSAPAQPIRRMEWVGLGLVVVLWVALCANNLYRLPLIMGFDADAHLEYVDYVRARHRLPKATDGWEMYQPPLYYVVSAWGTEVARLAGLSEADARAMLPKTTSMASGLAHVLLAWCVARVMFPENGRARMVALILAAAMPMNLYISQCPSNEAMCAALVSAALALALRIVRDGITNRTPYAGLGLLLGLAVLTKYTALLALAGVLIVLGGVQFLRVRREGWRLLPRTVGVLLGIVVPVGGWFYLRNGIEFGNPLIGNWDPASGFNWWIDPGYGTRGYYLRFGRSLTRPLEGWLYSYADSLYSTVWGDAFGSGDPTPGFRPPWHYPLMSVGYSLALFPTVLMGVGLVAAFVRWIRSPGATWTLLVGHGAMVAFGVFYMTLKLPYYYQAKGFYALSAMACLCVLGAWGFDRLYAGLGRVGGMLWVPLLVWATNAYATFLVFPIDAETHSRLGAAYCKEGQTERGLRHLHRAMQLDGGNLLVIRNLAEALYRQNRYAEVRDVLQEALRIDPDNPMKLSYMILLLSSCPDETVRDGREALRLAEKMCRITGPDYPPSLNMLAAAQAELGRYAEAVQTVTRALTLAASSADPSELAEMRLRLELYKLNRPYRYRLED